MEYMKKNGIETGIHYNPVHLMKYYKHKTNLPFTEQVGKEIVSIPTHPNLKKFQVDFIISSINNFFKNIWRKYDLSKRKVIVMSFQSNFMFDGKKILITGGTGSLGTELTKRLLKTNAETIRIFSRDEWKQKQMQSEIIDERLRFFIGDIRDKERLSRALEDVNIVIHAAALKHVEVAEYNPFEFVKTNVYGTQNLIEACLDKNVEIV